MESSAPLASPRKHTDSEEHEPFGTLKIARIFPLQHYPNPDAQP